MLSFVYRHSVPNRILSLVGGLIGGSKLKEAIEAMVINDMTFCLELYITGQFLKYTSRRVRVIFPKFHYSMRETFIVMLELSPIKLPNC